MLVLIYTNWYGVCLCFGTKKYLIHEKTKFYQKIIDDDVYHRNCFIKFL